MAEPTKDPHPDAAPDESAAPPVLPKKKAAPKKAAASRAATATSSDAPPPARAPRKKAPRAAAATIAEAVEGEPPVGNPDDFDDEGGTDPKATLARPAMEERPAAAAPEVRVAAPEPGIPAPEVRVEPPLVAERVAPPPEPPPLYASPATRDQDRGLDAHALVPVILAVLFFVLVIYSKCSSDSGSETVAAPDAGDVVVTAADPGSPPPAPAPDSGLPPSIPVPPQAPAPSGPALDPQGSPGDTAAELLARSGVEKLERGDVAGAKADVDAALLQAPGSARYERLKARILSAEGNHQAALDVLGQAVAHDGRNPDVYRQRAASLMALGDDRGAARNMQAAERLANGTAPTSPP